jgi:hypothetical protein
MLQMRAPSRQLRTLGCTAALATTAIVALSGGGHVAAQSATASADRAAQAKAATRPARTRPIALSDSAAARLVHRSRWEPRPSNRGANNRRPNTRELRHFRRHSALPRRYKRRITGNYRGTTDQIIQWAAYKWGFHPDVLRGVATIESWWRQRAVGDEGQSYGLFQIKKGHHCCHPVTQRSTAFNADYWAGYLRSIYNGDARWLNGESRGSRYHRGELWESVGVWYSGRWDLNNGHYQGRVKDTIRKRVWRRTNFRYGD